jgi:hypothetical protein
VQTVTEQPFQELRATSDLARAQALMTQLGITGEIQWPAAAPVEGRLAFQGTRPGLILDVKADLESGPRDATTPGV